MSLMVFLRSRLDEIYDKNLPDDDITYMIIKFLKSSGEERSNDSPLRGA